MFRYLRDIASLIPVSVAIPPEKSLRVKDIFGFGKETMVDGKTVEVSDGVSIKEAVADGEGVDVTDEPNVRLLVPFDLSQHDVKYLDDYRDSLIEARSAIRKDCLRYLRCWHAHFELGQRLLRENSERNIKKLMSAYPSFKAMCIGEEGSPKPRTVPTATRERRLGIMLRCLAMDESKLAFERVSNPARWIPQAPYFPFPSSAPETPTSDFGTVRRFRWMLGHVSRVDATVVHLLLMIENPQFTAASLFDADIYDKKAKSRFELSVGGMDFSIDKQRAKAMKTSTLSAESIFAIQLLLECLRKKRETIAQDHALKNKLFLVNDEHGLRGVTEFSMYDHLNRCDDEGNPTFPLFPTVKTCLHITLPVIPRRIRATSAVLEWFKTGSVTAASVKLGNTTKMVLAHYIPPELLAAWNRRMVRRFHNLLLCAAAAQEPYLLDVTDFSTEAELKAFIVDMLEQHPATSSQLAGHLHKRFDARRNDAESISQELDNASLILPISSEILGELYACRDFYYAGDASSESNAPTDADIPSRSLAELADLLHAMLPSHRDVNFRAAHEAGVLRAAILQRSIRARPQVVAEEMS